MKREHGKHNKAVCDKLHLQSDLDCNDWVLTTAFYSSIHFFDHLLFPCEYKGATFQDINEAFKILKNPNKHETRGVLVAYKYPLLGGDYNFLKEGCYNARYYEFRVNERISDTAVQRLEKIIKVSDNLYNSTIKKKKR
jgi:hypothetical protein